MAATADVNMEDSDAAAKVQNANDYADLLETNHSDAFAFSATEQLILDLYDQLHELELQQSLFKARQTGTSDTCDRVILLGTDRSYRSRT